MANKEVKKNKQESLEPDLKAIAEFEKAQRKSASKKDLDSAVDFDQWWTERASVLNQPAHIKEILRADAKGRGLGKKETMERWDWAAKMFGLHVK